MSYRPGYTARETERIQLHWKSQTSTEPTPGPSGLQQTSTITKTPSPEPSTSKATAPINSKTPVPASARAAAPSPPGIEPDPKPEPQTTAPTTTSVTWSSRSFPSSEKSELKEDPIKSKLLFGGRFGERINPQTHRVDQSYALHKYQTVIVTKNKTKQNETIAMRLRQGRVGQSQWLSELLVYLLPNFNHPNILPFLGCDKRLKCASEQDNSHATEAKESEQQPKQDNQAKTKKRRKKRVSIRRKAQGGSSGTHSDDSSNELLEDGEKKIEKKRNKKSSKEEPTSTTDNRDGASKGSLHFDTDKLLEKVEPDENSSDYEEPDGHRITGYRRRDSKGEAHGPYRVDHHPEGYRRRRMTVDVRHTIEYWILNDFYDCITLRHYLMMYTISWSQLLNIARGIVLGLHFLHEQVEYQEWDTVKKVDSYIRSTNGALKKVAFKEQKATIHMKPHLAYSIIHRNLSSLNIVLRRDLRPCIWNFGTAFICHPFQPVNYNHQVDWPILKILESSPYSPPEVLLGRGNLSVHSLKAIDMYSAGIVFWEMLTRCDLPKLVGASEVEARERDYLEEYEQPFVREFGEINNCRVLQHAVCRHRCRPRCKWSWVIGKKTGNFMQLMRELWDQDSDARLYAITTLERINRMDPADFDERAYFLPEESRWFNIETMWPPGLETAVPLLPERRDSNIVYESLEDLVKSEEADDAGIEDNADTVDDLTQDSDSSS